MGTPVGIGNHYGVEANRQGIDVLRSSPIGPHIGIRSGTTAYSKVNGSCTLAKAKDIGGSYRRRNGGIGLRNLGGEVGLAPVGIGNKDGVDACGQVLNILGRSTIVPNIGVRSYPAKDAKVNGTGVLGKTKHVGIYRNHRKRRSRLGHIGGVGSHTPHSIGNGVGVRARHKVEDVFGCSAVGPRIREGRVGACHGDLYRSVAAPKTRYIANDRSNYGTLWGLVNGEGIGD